MIYFASGDIKHWRGIDRQKTFLINNLFSSPLHENGQYVNSVAWTLLDLDVWRPPTFTLLCLSALIMEPHCVWTMEALLCPSTNKDGNWHRATTKWTNYSKLFADWRSSAFLQLHTYWNGWERHVCLDLNDATKAFVPWTCYCLFTKKWATKYN